MSDRSSQATATAREYYNSSDADKFYAEVWGGEDIHIGLYESADEPIADASRRTVDFMAECLGPVGREATVLDIGAGYGGAARRLGELFGCGVVCLNLSEVENERNRAMNQQRGMDQQIRVIDGSFEEIPLDSGSADVVWSQDAMLHSGARERVLKEVDRVLADGGRFIFTDPMRSDECPREALKPILDRIHLTDLGTVGFYRDQAAGLGWREASFRPMTEQLVRHYTRVLETIEERELRLRELISQEYIDRMKAGLRHWIRGGESGHLVWGVFLFEKP